MNTPNNVPSTSDCKPWFTLVEDEPSRKMMLAAGAGTDWTDPSQDTEVTAEQWKEAFEVLPPLACKFNDEHQYFYGSEPCYHGEGAPVVVYGYIKDGRYYLGNRAWRGNKPQH